MKVCIVGVGAIGGWIGAKLAAARHEVSALARGATLQALRAHGLRLHEGERVTQGAVRASDDAAQLGSHELVIVAVKGPSLGQVAPQIASLMTADTIVMTAMNGVPWWFFDGVDGPHNGLVLQSVDPQGALRSVIATRQVVGCVVHASCSTAQPGVVRHAVGRGLILGEALGLPSRRVDVLCKLFNDAGFEASTSPSIQRDIWYKLWGNMTMNPVSALTGATCDRILDDPLTNALCLQAMAEAAAIGHHIGCPIAQSGADRNAVTRKLGAFKTSMLQDVEAGKPLEIDALLGAVHEIGARVGVPTPTVNGLLGLTRLYARERGLYR
jgi:2-dehydropantoate 2-reductase